MYKCTNNTKVNIAHFQHPCLDARVQFRLLLVSMIFQCSSSSSVLFNNVFLMFRSFSMSRVTSFCFLTPLANMSSYMMLEFAASLLFMICLRQGQFRMCAWSSWAKMTLQSTDLDLRERIRLTSLFVKMGLVM